MFHNHEYGYGWGGYEYDAQAQSPYATQDFYAPQQQWQQQDASWRAINNRHEEPVATTNENFQVGTFEPQRIEFLQHNQKIQEAKASPAPVPKKAKARAFCPVCHWHFASLQSRTQHIGNDSCLGSAKAAGLPIPDASKIKEVKKSVAGNRLSHLQEEHDARAAQWRMERENVNLKRMEEVRGGKGEGEETPTPSADWDERLEKAMKRVAALGPPRQRTAPPRPERVRKVRAHRYRKRENNTGTTTPSVTGHVDNGMELGDHVQWGPETLYANASGSMYHASYGPDPVFAGNLDYVEHPMTFHGYQQGQPQQPQSQWTSNGGVYDDDPSAQYPALSAYEGWQQTLQRGSHYEGYENSAAWIASPTAGGSVIEGGEEWLAENGYAGYHETEPALQQQVPMQPYDPYGQMDGRWPQLPQSEASSEPPVETSMSTEAGYRPIGLTFQDTTQHSQIRAYDQRGGQPSTGEQQLAPPVGEFRMTDEETCRQVDDILASLDL